DELNKELYKSEGQPSFQIDAVMMSDIRRGEAVKFETQEYEGIGFLYQVNNARLTIFAAATDAYGMEALLNLQTILLITFGTSTLLVLCLGWFYAGKVLEPISAIVSDVGKMSGNNLNLRLTVVNPNDELGKLSNTFNNMLDRLESAFQSQKAFISNASHEIKTPITVMSGQLEVALLQDRNIGYYQSLIRKIVKDLKGLNNLSTRLLLLAQSADDQARHTFVALRVDDIVWNAKEELTKAHPEYTVDIHFKLELQHDALVIHGDEELLKVAFINLMDNGCKYSSDHSVKVQLSPGTNGMITLVFSNSGLIRSDDLPRIFDPFYRAVTSSASGKGFGIGLSLVKSVVNMHHGNVTVASKNPTTEFVVSLPV
ncbi:MAG: ATP-binding protein, partial [Chryseolinea sp.]